MTSGRPCIRPSFGQIARIAGWAPTPFVGLGDGVYASRRVPVFLAASQQAAVDLCGGLNCRFASHHLAPRFGWLPASFFPPHERLSIEFSIREAQKGELHGDAAQAVHSLAQEATKFAESLPNSRTGEPCYVFVRSFPGLREPFPLDRFVVLSDEEVGPAMEAEGQRWAAENGEKITEVFRRRSARVTGGPPRQPRIDDAELLPDETRDFDELLLEVMESFVPADEDPPKNRYQFRHTGAVYEVRFDGESGTIEAKLDGAKYIFELLQHPNKTYTASELYSLMASPAPRKEGEGATQTAAEPAKKVLIDQDRGELLDLKGKLLEEKACLEKARNDGDSLVESESQEAIQAIGKRIRQLSWNGQIRKDDPARKIVCQAIQRVIDKCPTKFKVPRLAQFLGQYIDKGGTLAYRPADPAPDWQF